jgi:hypothetical protein
MANTQQQAPPPPQQPPPPNYGAKDLGRYRDLGRGPFIDFYRDLAARTGHAPNADAWARLAAFVRNPRNGWQYVVHSLRYIFNAKQKYQTYPAGSGIYPVDNELFLSVAGDWGTGTDEAEKVSRLMESHNPDYTIHLGDVYYIGDRPEIETNCLNVPTRQHSGVKWRHGTKGSFALCGNHEMYACGTSYFQDFLPTLGFNGGNGQGASFFCFRNNYWRIIGIDTGYNSVGWAGLLNAFRQIDSFRSLLHALRGKSSCRLEPELMHWLKDVMIPNADGTEPATILLSHHQYYSAFDFWYTLPAKQLHKFIKKTQPVLWFWGHEHRFAVYGKHGVRRALQAHGRCVGHGGMPVERGTKPFIPQAPCLYYDDRQYHNNEGIDVGYNGFVDLQFKGPNLTVNYYDLNNMLLLTEDWSTNKQGILSGPQFSNLNGLTLGPALGGLSSTMWQTFVDWIKALI